MTSIARRLDKHFVACAAAAAGAALVGPANTAEAVIVWSGIVNLTIPSTTNGLYLNVVNGAYNTTGGLGTTVPGWDVNPFSSTGLSHFNPATSLIGGSAYVRANTTTAGVSNLAPGTLISGASLYSSGAAQTSGTNPFVLNSSSNLVGFRFHDESDGRVKYGWMRYSLGSSLAAQPRTLIEYAYEDENGVGIMAGVVPAPGALALLGLAGLAGARRRRA